MNLTQILNRVPEYRVNASTYRQVAESRAMIGGEFEAREIDYKDKTIGLSSVDRAYWFNFNFSDVQELTPLSFNGKRIAIGDEVMIHNFEKLGWRKVVGFLPAYSGWLVGAIDVFGHNFYLESEITAHRTPTSTTRTLEDVLSTLPDSDKEIIRKAVK